MKFKPIITGFLLFLLVMGFLLINRTGLATTVLFIGIIGFINGMILKQDFNRSVVVFFFIGFIPSVGLFSLALVSPDPEPIDYPIEDEGPTRVFIPLIGYKAALAILAFLIFIVTVLTTPLIWIGSLIGAQVIIRYKWKHDFAD